MNSSKSRGGVLYLVPALIALGVIIVFPLVFGFITSFMSWNWAAGESGQMRFVGLSNYVTLMRDQHFWTSVLHTLYFTAGALAAEFALGLICALLLNQDIRFKWFFRTAFIFPLVVSDIVAALVWKMILNPTLGPLNYYLRALGLGAPNWFGDPLIVIPMAMMVDTWWQTGQITIILLAGLQGMDRSVLEVSMIDGANAWQRLRYVILPILKPIIVVALLFRSIDLLRVFAIIWGITEGGPGRASEVTQLYIYWQGVGRYLKMGYSAALAVAFSAIVALFIVSYVKYQERTAENLTS